MLPLIVKTKILNSPASLNKVFNLNIVKFYNRKVDTVAKRGSILTEYITNRDKRKNWHFCVLSDKPKVRTFEKIHKPRRRANVLNSLFVRNITDVLSTGDIAPELTNHGVEITGVRIAPCNKILNVFWQLPVSHFDSSEEIGKLLNIASPKIRAELISRNVMGHVPFIFFLRDSTNERVANFERAMEKIDLGPVPDSPIVADDSFLKDLLTFKKKRTDKAKEESSISNDIEETTPHSNINDTTEASLPTPQKPVDMKCDIFGLDHDKMMQKVIASKKKKKEPPTKSALISIESLNEDDLFDKIPGTRFEIESSSSSRNEVLKQFQTERKMLRQKAKANESDVPNYIQDYDEEALDTELEFVDEDFFEEEPFDKPSR